MRCKLARKNRREGRQGAVRPCHHHLLQRPRKSFATFPCFRIEITDKPIRLMTIELTISQNKEKKSLHRSASASRPTETCLRPRPCSVLYWCQSDNSVGSAATFASNFCSSNLHRTTPTFSWMWSKVNMNCERHLMIHFRSLNDTLCIFILIYETMMQLG